MAINLDDINQARGDILIRQGKGRKPRTVFIGKHSRRALRRYLKHRKYNSDALWVTHPRFGSERLGYDGLRAIIHRHAMAAEVIEPSIHYFRRAFAINMLRAGVDIFTLQKLMGHADLQVLQRYLSQTTEDIAMAHRIGSPVDRAWL